MPHPQTVQRANPYPVRQNTVKYENDINKARNIMECRKTRKNPIPAHPAYIQNGNKYKIKIR